MESELLDPESITRCLCHKDDNEGLMIQCEECRVWQHCECVNIPNEQSCPPTYYCETCKPELHAYINEYPIPSNSVLATRSISLRRSRRSGSKSISPEEDRPPRKITKKRPNQKKQLVIIKKEEPSYTQFNYSSEEEMANIKPIKSIPVNYERMQIPEPPIQPFEMNQGEYLYAEPETPSSPKLYFNTFQSEPNGDANGKDNELERSPPSKPKQLHTRMTFKDMKKRVYQINGYLECLSDSDTSSTVETKQLIGEIKRKLSRFNEFI